MSGHGAAAEAYLSGQLATARALLVDLAEVLDSLGSAVVTQPQDHSADQEATNAERIAAELIDVFAVVDLLERGGWIPATRNAAAFSEKQRKIQAWMAHARATGSLQKT